MPSRHGYPSGISEIITHKENGILACQGDCKAFAQGIKELYCNKSLLKNCEKLLVNLYSRAMALKNIPLISSEASKCLLAEPAIPSEIEPFHNEYYWCHQLTRLQLSNIVYSEQECTVENSSTPLLKRESSDCDIRLAPLINHGELSRNPISTSKCPSNLEYLVFGTAEFVQEMEDIAYLAYLKTQIPSDIIHQSR